MRTGLKGRYFMVHCTKTSEHCSLFPSKASRLLISCFPPKIWFERSVMSSIVANFVQKGRKIVAIGRNYGCAISFPLSK